MLLIIECNLIIYIYNVLWVTFCHPIMLLRYADKRIVNIMKVYIERNNFQLELI